MGLFGWHNPKKEGCATDVTNLQDANNSFSSQSNISATMKVPKKRGNLKSPHSVPGEPSMKHLPDLILDLKTAVDTAHERSVGALRKLFALSEHAESNNRIEMVHAEDGALVPTLLYFLERCARKSPEQFLSLLVLNNMSIPTENKRVRAYYVFHSAAPFYIFRSDHSQSRSSYSVDCPRLRWSENSFSHAVRRSIMPSSGYCFGQSYILGCRA